MYRVRLAPATLLMALWTSLVLVWLGFALALGPALDVGSRWREDRLRGFSFAEIEGGRTFRWTEGPAAVRLDGLAAHRAYRLRLWVATRHPGPAPDARLTVLDRSLLFRPGHDWAPVELTLSTPPLLWDGRLLLRIDTPTFLPDPAGRELGLMVAQVEARPLARFAPLAVPPLGELGWRLALAWLGWLALVRLRFSGRSATFGVLGWQAAYAGATVLEPARFGSPSPAAALTLPAVLLAWVAGRALLRSFPHATERATLFGAAALGLTAAAAVYGRSLLANGPLGWDEADHTMWAHWIAEALRRWDLVDALAVTNRQTFWAPLYSWMQGLVFLLLGETMVTARLASLASLALAVPAAAVLGMQLAPGRARWPLGLAAAVAVAASPRLLTLSGTGMFETPVMLLVLLALAGHVRALHQGTSTAYLLSAAASFAVFMAKFNYGLILLAGLALGEFWSRRIRVWRQDGHLRLSVPWPAVAGFWLPVALAGLAWFGVSPREKLVGFLGFLVNPNTSGLSLSENLLFYPGALAEQYLPSAWLAWPLWIGLAWLVVRPRFAGQRVVAAYVLVGLLSALLHPLKADRYVAPMVPLWILVGMLGWASVLASLPGLAGVRRIRPAAALAGAGIAAVLVGLAWSRVGPVQSPGHQKPILEAALQAVTQGVPPGQQLLVLGTFAELSPPLLEWHLLTLEFDSRITNSWR